VTEARPIYPIHPGEVLAEQLEELEITAAELARELHVPANRLYQLIAGKRAMTADTALRLEQWLGVSADFWMNLQKTYELDRAYQEIGPEIRHSIHRHDCSCSFVPSVLERCCGRIARHEQVQTRVSFQPQSLATQNGTGQPFD
jgi:addiction module HigA family antidote